MAAILTIASFFFSSKCLFERGTEEDIRINEQERQERFNWN